MRKKIAGLAIVFLFVYLFPFGCTKLRPLEVVERSKPSRPEWLQHKKNTLIVSERSLKWVSLKSQVVEISLGIEQAKQQARTSMKLGLIETLKRKDPSLDLTSWSLDLEDMQLEDIYFEKLTSIDGQASYNLYVLLSYPLVEFNRVAKAPSEDQG